MLVSLCISVCLGISGTICIGQDLPNAGLLVLFLFCWHYGFMPLDIFIFIQQQQKIQQHKKYKG